MQSEHDLELDYNPADDWGAPLPPSAPNAAIGQGAPGEAPPSRPGSSAPVHGAGGADAPEHGSARGPAQPEGRPAAPPGKRCEGPARAAAGGPSLALPHAGKPGLFPAVFSRGALFRVGGADDPAVAAPPGQAAIAIPAQGGVHLTLSGPWPRMRDKAVWEIAIEMAKASPNAAAPMAVNLSQFADRLGCADKGGAALGWIWTSLRRLSLCRVELAFPSSARPPLAGSLLLAARETAGGREIEIDAAFAFRLLGEDFQFAIDRKRRASLSTALARWMHDFLSTHSTQGRPFDLAYLRALCGYGARPKSFPANLDKALADLVQKAPEVLAGYSIDKSTRSSDGWAVALDCGGEKRKFEQPKSAPNPAGARRPGVAL